LLLLQLLHSHHLALAISQASRQVELLESELATRTRTSS
jgi:hypothetical protein